MSFSWMTDRQDTSPLRILRDTTTSKLRDPCLGVF